MWFLARAELRHGRSRFALLAGLVALLAFLVFVMTGLSTGLGEATVSGMRSLTAGTDAVVLSADAQRSLARSDLPAADAATAATAPGVTGAWAVGQSMATLGARDHEEGVAVVGLPADAPTAPAGLADRPDGVVLDQQVADDAGLHVGDTVTLAPGDLRLTVVGTEDLGSIQHAPVAVTSLSTWQRLRYAPFAPDGTAVPDRTGAVLVRTTGSLDAIGAATGAGTEVVTTATAVTSVPGYAEETGTIGMLRAFLFAIAALLVAVVFWVLTLQKEGPLAVLRTSGASRRLLLGAYLVQVLLVTVAGVALGLAAASGAAVLLPAGAFVLTSANALAAAGLLVVLAVAGSATSLRRLLTVDPLLSLGRIG